MPKILEINTSESLYEPSEVVIDGKTFQVKEITLGGLDKIQTLYQEAIATGSAKAIRGILQIVLGTDEVFDSLTMRQVKTLVNVTVEKSLNPPEGPEKNAPSPGDAGLP